MSKKPILEVQELKMYFQLRGSLLKRNNPVLKAVDGISFSINQGDTLGLVGESGCGKTTVGRAILRLYEPTAGKIIYDESEIQGLQNKDLLPFRKKIQMIFQDPYSSLDPRMTIGDIIMQPMVIHGIGNRREERIERAYNLLKRVGLKEEHFTRYPHEFSGGQRQRVGIARALAINPEFIICDEPISALDVSIQAQVVNMLEELQADLGLTYLFISHDLSMIRHISHKVAVMYLGNLVEYAETEELFRNPLHPYTMFLLSAIPKIEDAFSNKKRNAILKGELPSPINPPPGCVLSTRCPYATEECKKNKPAMRNINGHEVACHLAARGMMNNFH